MHKVERAEFGWVAGIGFGTPLLGAMLAGQARLLSPLLYAFAASFVVGPVLAAAIVAYVVRNERARSRPLRWFFDALAIAELPLQVAGQLICYAGLDKDAQAALGFIFLPMYAHVLAFGAAFLAAVVALLVDRRRRHRAPGPARARG